MIKHVKKYKHIKKWLTLNIVKENWNYFMYLARFQKICSEVNCYTNNIQHYYQFCSIRCAFQQLMSCTFVSDAWRKIFENSNNCINFSIKKKKKSWLYQMNTTVSQNICTLYIKLKKNVWPIASQMSACQHGKYIIHVYIRDSQMLTIFEYTLYPALY